VPTRVIAAMLNSNLEKQSADDQNQVITQLADSIRKRKEADKRKEKIEGKNRNS
jgi:hypothetical protein